MGHRKSPIRALALGVAIAISFVLAGCDAADPDATPLPVSTEERAADDTSETSVAPALDTLTTADLPLDSEAPKTEEEAIEYAQTAARLFFEAEAEIINNHPEDTSLIELIAVGDPVTSVEIAASQVLEAGMARTGEQHFQVDPALTTVADDDANESSVSFAYVELWGCLDASEVRFTSETGM